MPHPRLGRRPRSPRLLPLALLLQMLVISISPLGAGARPLLSPGEGCPSNCTLAAGHRPCVCTTSGRLVGSRVAVEFANVEDARGPDLVRGVNVWLGVPYGLPPVDFLRFGRPVELARPGQWLTCASAKPACYQAGDGNYADTPGSRMWISDNVTEDCLNLNVWAPDGPRSERPLTTMVWIYGGSFTTGSANLDIYDGRYLAASQNVIVVSMNYRVGPFGFLYFNDSRVPGNMGLWDQWLALKWVAANAARFGGHSDRVSLFGESAGAVSVSLHTVSPWSQTLFHHSAMQSGGLHCHWAVMRPVEAFNKSLQFARRLNCSAAGSSLSAIIACLRGRSARELMRAFGEMFLQKNYFEFVFSPVFDRDFLPFRDFSHLLDTSKRFFKKGSQMFGINKNEGTYFLLYAFLNNSQWASAARMNDRVLRIQNEATYDKYIHKIMNPFQRQGGAIYEMLFQRAKFQYTENDDVYTKSGSEAYVQALDRMSGDLSFKCPVIYTATEAVTNHSRVFFYEFNYRQQFLPWPSWTGVMHGYEIDFVFGAPFNREFQRKFYTYTYKEKVLSWYMMKYWANFAKTGDPNLSDHSEPFVSAADHFINWQPVNGSRRFDGLPPKYLAQTLRTLKVDEAGLFRWSAIEARQLRDCAFWKWHVTGIYAEMLQRRQPHCSP